MNSKSDNRELSKGTADRIRLKMPRGIISGALQSLVTGASLLIGYLIQNWLNIRLDPFANSGINELLQISAALSCSYAFIFVICRNYSAGLLYGRISGTLHIMLNITGAYLMEMALLLFFRGPALFPDPALISLGYLSCMAIAPSANLIMAILHPHRPIEGKRKLILKSFGMKEMNADVPEYMSILSSGYIQRPENAKINLDRLSLFEPNALDPVNKKGPETRALKKTDSPTGTI